MGGSSFEQLVQEVLKQKQLMDQLETENRDLRRQLAELRAGRGIFVDIGGRRFALASDALKVETSKAESGPHRVVPAPAPQPATPVPTSPNVAEAVVMSMAVPDIAEAPTTAMPPVMETPVAVKAEVAEGETKGTPSTPLPSIELFEEDERKTPASTFLEEALIDEFAAASTTPLAVWQAPAKKKEVDEDEKAALRRQLIGSYLLE